MKQQTKISNLPVSTVFLSEHLLQIPSGLSWGIRTLSHKELHQVSARFPDSNRLKYEVAKLGSIDNVDDVVLSIKDIEFIAEAIMHISTLNADIIDGVTTLLDIKDEKMVSQPDFKCDVCQEKGLDKTRNCPLLDKDTHEPSLFYLLGNKKYTECPMDIINKYVEDTYTTFNILNSKFLPEVGGMVDQTKFVFTLGPYIVGKMKTLSDDISDN